MRIWGLAGAPRSGWFYGTVEDLGDPSGICEMCNKEQIRYMHVLEHFKHPTLRVGCICAEKMTEDRTGPRTRENKVKSKAARKKKWLTRKWKTSVAGNDFLNTDGKNVVIYQKDGRWGFKVGDTFSSEFYPTSESAKLEAFEVLWKE